MIITAKQVRERQAKEGGGYMLNLCREISDGITQLAYNAVIDEINELQSKGEPVPDTLIRKRSDLEKELKK